MFTYFEYDGIVVPWRNCIALMCLAVLCLAALTPAAALLLWAIVLPLCFVFSLVITIGAFSETTPKPSQPDVRSLLQARAPPTRS